MEFVCMLVYVMGQLYPILPIFDAEGKFSIRDKSIYLRNIVNLFK